MIKRFVIFLVRKKLGLKKGEFFRFSNQKSDAIYYFKDDCITKVDLFYGKDERLSSVSLNWLLSDECEIQKVSW